MVKDKDKDLDMGIMDRDHNTRTRHPDGHLTSFRGLPSARDDSSPFPPSLPSRLSLDTPFAPLQPPAIALVLFLLLFLPVDGRKDGLRLARAPS